MMIITLLLISASARVCPVALAFSVRPPSTSVKLANNADGVARCDKPADRSTPHPGAVFDLIRSDRLLRRCNLPLVAAVASAAILCQPAPASSAMVADPSWSSSIALTTTAADLSTMTPSSIAELGLKPATAEKPQITFSGDRIQSGQSSQISTSFDKSASARKPILQGLVYFPERAPTDPNARVPSGQQEKRQLDYYSDILVLTAVSAAQPDGPVLAGAKFPVSAVRFPFSFQMYKENLLLSRPGVQDAWEKVAGDGDVIVRASICPSDASAFPCSVDETKKYAEGVAKLITNLPGLRDGESIRAPASLPLQ